MLQDGFPGDVWTASGASIGDGYYDVAANAIGAVASIYSYGDICTNNNSGACTSTGGVVLGGANSGAAANITNSGNAFFDGSVEIGNNASPVSQLTVVSPTNSSNAYFTVLPQNLSQSVNIGYNHLFEGGGNGNNALQIDSQGTGNLLLQTDGGTGDVGIGTTDPGGYKLEVNGPTQIDGTITANDYLQLNAYPGYGSGTGQMFYNGTSGSMEVTGNLALSPSNPTLYTGGSYLTIPYGLYVSGGTTYIGGTLEARDGIGNDQSVPLYLLGGGTGYATVVDGHLLTGGTMPAISSCASGASVSGTDTAGVVTAGSGAYPGCSITFGIAYATTPVCTVSQMSSMTEGGYYTVAPYIISVSATLLNVGLDFSNGPATFPSGYQLSYICIGH